MAAPLANFHFSVNYHRLGRAGLRISRLWVRYGTVLGNAEGKAEGERKGMRKGKPKRERKAS